MAAGEQVTFEPAFALMLAQHLHHPAIGGDVIIAGNNFRSRSAVRYAEQIAPTIRRGFVRAEDAKIIEVEFDHVADEFALDACRLAVDGAGPVNFYGVTAKIC